MAAKGKKKNFVLDTNVMLHDYECIEKFEENDIYIPIVSLEELDKFKKEANKSTSTHELLSAVWMRYPIKICSRKELLWEKA